ncbi:MAG: TonB-dependent receptor, partial [Rhodothermales bacterium]|nr:TonB-dependent receptor [Rhodothermales bacterium]
DTGGRYAIDDLEPRLYTLVVSSVGYETQRRSVAVEAGVTARVDFVLVERSLDIGEVVVTARETLTGGPDGIRDLPGTAHYIGLEELQSYAATDVHRVLREIPGVNIQEEDGYGLRPNVGLRGTGSERSSRITLMEDGVLIAPAPYAAPSAYYFPTVGRMSGVEVRKGASQIQYGPYTTGGALNLLSTPIPADFSGYASGFVGEDRARNLHAWAGNSWRNAGFLVETHVANVEGFKRLFPFEDADTGYDKQDILAKFRLNTDPDAAVYQALTLKLSRTDELSNETYLGLTATDFDRTPFLRYAGSQLDEMDAEHTQVQVRHVAVFSERFDLTTTAYRNTFARNWYKLDGVRDGIFDEDEGQADAKVGISSVLDSPDVFADELAVIRGERTEGALYVKANNREYWSEGVQTVAGFRADLGPVPTEWEAGLRVHRDGMDRFQWVDTYAMVDGARMSLVEAGTPGTDSNRIERAEAVAAFAQAEVGLGRLTLTPGLRFEHVALSREDYGKADPGRAGTPEERENSVDAVIPGLGASYEWTPSLITFASVHRGFAPPSSKEGVEPEESVNVEAGLRYDVPAMSLQAAVYYHDYQNLLGSDLAAAGGGGTPDLFNGGEARVYGAELALDVDLAQPLRVGGVELPARLAYTFTDAAFSEAFESEFDPWGTVAEGDELPYVAAHQLAASLGAKRGRLSGEARGTYVGAMRTVAGQGAAPADQRIDAHVVLDLSAEFAVDSRTAVFGGVRNALDEVYVAARRPAGLRPGLPRTFLLGVRTSL